MENLREYIAFSNITDRARVVAQRTRILRTARTALCPMWRHSSRIHGSNSPKGRMLKILSHPSVHSVCRLLQSRILKTQGTLNKTNCVCTCVQHHRRLLNPPLEWKEPSVPTLTCTGLVSPPDVALWCSYFDGTKRAVRKRWDARVVDALREMSMALKKTCLAT